MSYPTIVFPPPPPAHNTLTITERYQLLRSNAKIGQLLGSTPHVLDEIPRNDSITSFSSLHRPKARRQSVDSATFYDQPENASSSFSRSTLDLAPSRSSYESSRSTTSSRSTQRVMSRLHSEKVRHTPFPSSNKPPILRIGKYHSSSSSLSSSSSQEEDSSDGDASAHSPTSATFAIPSEAAMRRQKMARLRKRLGENVPVHLVFPPTASVDPELDDEDADVAEGPEVLRSQPAQTEHRDLPDPQRSCFVHPDPEVSRAGKRPPAVRVHYGGSGTRGWESETFRGLRITCRRITTIPEE